MALVCRARRGRLRSRRGTPSSQWNRSPRHSRGLGTFRRRVSFTWPTPRLRCTTPWSRSRAVSSRMVSDHGTAGSVGRLRSSRSCLPHASLLLLGVPSSRGEPRRLLRRGALQLRRCTTDGGAALLSARQPNRYHHLRTDDGRMTPINVTSSFPTLPPAPSVWRLTAAIRGAGRRRGGRRAPIVLQSLDQFRRTRRPRFRARVGRGLQPD